MFLIVPQTKANSSKLADYSQYYDLRQLTVDFDYFLSVRIVNFQDFTFLLVTNPTFTDFKI